MRVNLTPILSARVIITIFKKETNTTTCTAVTNVMEEAARTGNLGVTKQIIGA